ncbi:MAG: glycosyltransferase [Thiocapsa sp.]|uniref:glycosyltransferase n=1 Tax=Thiocapsa sp. TaxID=2024551 RepID=UPI001BD0F0B2|nr:glycosyltransferase [Thiocapsa sp.]QVL50094.1 MAG: glycosyltransferase [Thiocapsa sp.]
MKRVLLAAHVLTEGERLLYSERFGVAQERFFCLPWPLKRAEDPTPAFRRAAIKSVVSSGRMFCDWVTLLKAAEGADWDLTIICAEEARPVVEVMAQRVGARVLSNVSLEEHQQLLARANVYVISLHEAHISSGQIRVMNAVRAGVPIVATKVLGLEGYLKDGKTAVLVNPGDTGAMRRGIDCLLRNPDRGVRLAETLWHEASMQTFEQYLDALKQTVHRILFMNHGRVSN